MSLEHAPRISDAAADAIDALAHLALFATANGHRRYAGAALLCLETLLSAPDARKVVPAEYLEAGALWLGHGGDSHHAN